MLMCEFVFLASQQHSLRHAFEQSERDEVRHESPGNRREKSEERSAIARGIKGRERECVENPANSHSSRDARERRAGVGNHGRILESD